MEAYMIIDGLWGSCGKGLIAGYLAETRRPTTVVCNFGPNAGHTYIDRGGRKILTKQLPTGIINEESLILIGPGAIIDPDILLAEIEEFKDLNIFKRLHIHPNAAVVLPSDKKAEKSMTVGIASTMKGTGSAIMRKISRNRSNGPRTIGEYISEGGSPELQGAVDLSANWFNRIVGHVQIESAQGVDLSINHGVRYPYTTSRDITPESVLNDVGIPMRYLMEVVAVYRTYPIRVGHVVEDGKKLGDSGPSYYDQKELTWKELSERTGQDLEERTTVTNRVRRVFEFSWDQFHKTNDILGGPNIFLNFANYLTRAEVGLMVNRMNNYDGTNVKWVGMGPSFDDVININDWMMNNE